MTKHASSHIIADDYLPTTTSDALQHAILIELRALNARQDEEAKPRAVSHSTTAAPRRDDAAKPGPTKSPVKRSSSARATAAPKKEPVKK